MFTLPTNLIVLIKTTKQCGNYVQNITVSAEKNSNLSAGSATATGKTLSSKASLVSTTPQERTNSVAPEPEGSSPHSQQPPSGPYPEPGESTPHSSPPTNLPKVHPPTYAFVFKVVFFLRAFPPKSCARFSPLPCVPGQKIKMAVRLFNERHLKCGFVKCTICPNVQSVIRILQINA
jgi:hypothetical protein